MPFDISLREYDPKDPWQMIDGIENSMIQKAIQTAYWLFDKPIHTRFLEKFHRVFTSLVTQSSTIKSKSC